MTSIPSTLATIASNWQSYGAAIGVLVLLLGGVGHALTALGNFVVRAPWAPVRALGHTLTLAGGLLTSVCSHWGAIYATITKALNTLRGALPAKGGAAVGVLAIMFCATMTTGCNGTLARDVGTVLDVVEQASAYAPDAEIWIQRVVAAEQELFAASPNPAAQAAFDADIDDARAALQVAIQNLANAKDVTPTELAQAYSGFVAAAEKVASDADALGLFAAPASGVAASHALPADVTVRPAPPPLPLCVRRAKGLIS